MRLALFTDTFGPQMNGVSRTLARLVDAVRVRGGEVRVFTTSDPRARAEPDVIRWPSASCPFYPELRLVPPRTRRAIHALDEYQPTLVHAATPFGAGLAGRAAARALRVPFVTSYHTSFSAYARFYGLGALEDPIWRMLRWFHNGGLRTFCPTNAIGTELAARGFERLAVWGRGVDRRRFVATKRSRTMRLRMGGSDGRLVVAYVGRIAREKGLDHVIQAMHRIGALDSSLNFAFAGDGPYLDHCRVSAPASCRFLGRLEGEELAEFYASADVFLFPSTTDTFGNVLLEAMATGLPIIAADTNQSREIVGESAVWYAPGSATALASAISEVASSSARRRELGAVAWARAANHSWDVVFDGLLADYATALREPVVYSLCSRVNHEHLSAVGA